MHVCFQNETYIISALYRAKVLVIGRNERAGRRAPILNVPKRPHLK